MTASGQALNIRICLTLTAALVASSAAHAQSWTFDGPVQTAGLSGLYSYVPGVSGQALDFDGNTTRIIVPAADATPLGQAFTLSAWIAPRTYPWNHAPLLDQSDSTSGYSLSLDAFGHATLDIVIDGTWQHVVSRESLALRKWSLVTATFDAKAGARLYIDGELQATTAKKGTFTPAAVDLYVGRVRTPQLPYPDAWIHPKDPIVYSLDGYLDEISAMPGALSPRAIKVAFQKARVTGKEVVPLAVLPTGAPGPGPFGAYYTTLHYTPNWDRTRRLPPDSDIIVRFPQSGMRLIFWQGLSFIPAWVTANQKWYTDEFLEVYTRGRPGAGDCEPMSDRDDRFSHVEIVESTTARAVIHWRYALVESREGKGANPDPETGGTDWADETWTVYPDGVAVRKQVLHSSLPADTSQDMHEWQESIIVNGTGQRPEDNINPDALTLGNMAGQTQVYSWTPKTDDAFSNPKGPDKLDLANANIQWVNLKSDEKPFQIVAPVGAWFDSYNSEPSHAMFEWWNHWPTSQIDSSGRPAIAADRPSHSSLSHIHWAATEVTKDSATKLLLDGLTTLPAALLLPVARAWLSPPSVTGATFDPSQRAFVVQATSNVTLRVNASTDHPLVDPAFVVEGWTGPARVLVDGQPAQAQIGNVSGLERDKLIVYLPLTTEKLVTVTISHP